MAIDIPPWVWSVVGYAILVTGISVLQFIRYYRPLKKAWKILTDEEYNEKDLEALGFIGRIVLETIALCQRRNPN